MNKPVPSVSKEAMGLLLAHDWPGNVRELQNAMERAVLISQGGEIGPEALPFYSNSSRPAGSGKSLAEAESVHIHKVLEESEWNISRAARMLQIDRVTLYNKMKRYGLRRDQ